MADANTTLVGNVTRDPELRYTASGRGVSSFGMAVNHRFKRQDEWTEEVSFFNVVAWGELGENLAASIVKGNRLMVTGRLTQRKYTNREGNEISTVELVADSAGPDLRWATAVVERTERTSGEASRSSRQAPAEPEEAPF